MMYIVTTKDNYNGEIETERMNATAYNNFRINNAMCGDYEIIKVETEED